MTKPIELVGDVNEDSPFRVMACIRGASDTPITQATVTAVSYLVKQYDSEDDARDNANGTSIQTLTSAGSVSSLIYDTLQTGNGWSPERDDGYNLLFTVPAAHLATGGKWYVVEIWIDPTSGDDFLGARQVHYCRHTAKD